MRCISRRRSSNQSVPLELHPSQTSSITCSVRCKDDFEFLERKVYGQLYLDFNLLFFEFIYIHQIHPLSYTPNYQKY